MGDTPEKGEQRKQRTSFRQKNNRSIKMISITCGLFVICGLLTTPSESYMAVRIGKRFPNFPSAQILGMPESIYEPEELREYEGGYQAKRSALPLARFG